MGSSDRAGRLMRMLAALEESIRLELQTEGETGDVIRRLRLVQGEILTALHLLEGDFPPPG